MKTGFVKLSEKDVALGRRIGATRNTEANRRGYKHKYGMATDGVFEHELGALGELAVARLWGVDWPATVNTYKRVPDLQGCEIRTRRRLQYELIVRRDDPDSAPFILVHLVKHPHSFNVTGWILGKDAKNSQFLRGHGGRHRAYFVPTNMLKDLCIYSARCARCAKETDRDLLHWVSDGGYFGGESWCVGCCVRGGNADG